MRTQPPFRTLAAVALSACLCGRLWAQQPTVEPAPSPSEAKEAARSTPGADAPDETSDAGDLLDLDIEQLRRTSVAPALDMEVSTVSRQSSTVGRSPAAVYVVTPEMIRRSGAQSIPEALRMVPGLQVAHRDANKWAISSRGFNQQFAKKLLVQIDGRTVYTPVFAGTYWDAQDVVMEDIERIEVIRGPGATLWGANAVNGVINIITKSSRDTTGIYAKAGGGSEEQAFGTARVGGRQDDLAWRGYFKWFERGAGIAVGGPAHDDWRHRRGGFRTDWTPSDRDTVTFQGDVYAGTNGTTFFGYTPLNERVQGHNVLARWSRVLDESTDWSFQAYYDVSDRGGGLLSQHVEVFDIDYQYRFPIGCRHNVIYGLGYRRVKDSLIGNAIFSFDPPHTVKNLTTAFVQDEIALREDRLYLTLGSKLEKNDFTGFEVQPSIRLLYLPSEQQAVWGSISRAVRTPSRNDADSVNRFTFEGGPAVIGPSPGMRSEELIAYELGYRVQPSERFSWDVSLFYNVYEDLRSRQITDVSGVPQTTYLQFFNDMQGDGYGFEVTGSYQLTDCWKLTAWYSMLHLNLKSIDYPPQSGQDPNRIEGSSPQNQAFLMSSWDLRHNIELDLMGRYVDALEAQLVPSYLSLDLRLGWHPRRDLEFAIVGQNLLDSHHLEFGNRDGLPVPAVEVQRGVYGSAVWRY